MSLNSLKTLSVVLVLMLGSCSAPEERDSGQPVSRTFYSSALNVCGLIKQSEVEALIGYPFSAGVGGFNPDWIIWTGLSACVYDNRASEGGSFYSGVIYAYADEIFQEVDRHLRPKGDDTDRGVRMRIAGATALWDPGVSQLMVLTKNKVVGIDIREELEPTENRLIRARRLAEKAMSRLK